MPTREKSVQRVKAPPSSHDRIMQAAKELFARRGYENTSTAAIARQAGTSESQLIKHFGSKEGLLEGIFDAHWTTLNLQAREALKGAGSPPEKLSALVGLVLGRLAADPELKLLLLLEGRRIRGGETFALLTKGFREFVGLLDEVLRQMQRAGQLRPPLRPDAVRSAMMGAIEGLLRDQLLAQRAGYPARFSTRDVEATFKVILDSFFSGPRAHS